MKNKDYYNNALKLKIKVIPYLILEHMYYHKKPIQVFKPRSLSYLGISKKLYDFYMNDLIAKKLVKKVGPNYELTKLSLERLSHYMKDKTYFNETFEEFYYLYPLKRDKKKALQKWFGLELNEVKFKEIINGTKRLIEERKKIKLKDPREFIPEWTSPATYILNERWSDILLKSTGEKEEIMNIYKKEKL